MAPNGMTADPHTTEAAASSAGLETIAERFVAARRQCQPLVDFPGPLPPDLATAYRIQDLAIERWDEAIRGWKVGRIPPALENEFRIDRLAGPIFGDTIRETSTDKPIDMPVYDGGFAAIEAEYVAVIGSDAPAGKLSWSTDEAAGMISDLRIGLEIASSPLASINELGPTVVVSDFGNNAGLIVGPSIQDWQTRSLDTMQCEAFVDGHSVGSGGAFTLTGGFVRSVQFLLELCAGRDLPLRAGTLVATGQTTGIHNVVAGQTGKADFGNDGELACRLQGNGRA